MAVPILLVAGFLGAGKTTVVNRLLADGTAGRIAAIVNDFGAINIDAALIAGAADGVVSLANGCICCSLEGDLLRAIASVLRQVPGPERIVIETSGVADPTDIVRNLMDPVIWQQATLETVLCLCDATLPEAKWDDPLLRAQVQAADILALSKTDLVGAAGGARLRAALQAIRPKAVIVDAPNGDVPIALLCPALSAPAPRPIGRAGPRAERFESFAWTGEGAVSLAQLRGAIGRLSPKLARAKGLFEAVEQSGREMLLQFASGRAALAPTAAGSGPDVARFVFIAEVGVLSQAAVDETMAGCLAGRM